MNELARPGSLVLAVCGASGQIYARAVLKVAARNNLPVDLILSANAVAVAAEELDGHDLDPGLNARIRRHPDLNLHSPLASGSHRTAGMIICPCTLNTLGALASGLSDNLIRRAAQVHLKQRRPLVLALRETPLGLIDLENLAKLARAGAVAAPLCPPFYHKPQTIEQLVDYTAERLVDLIHPIPLSFTYTGNLSHE